MTARRRTSAGLQKGSRARSRRGFALPLAVLLALVGSLAVVMLLERHNVLALAYRRQIDSYVDRHEGAGIIECTLNWISTARGGNPLEAVGDDGLAFSMDLPGGRRLSVYIEDGQGEALRETSMISGRRREIAQDAVFILDTMPEELKVDGMFRTAGPAEVSVNAAKPVVIRALCLAVLANPAKADQAAQIIVGRRSSNSGIGAAGKLKDGKLTSALQELGLSEEQKQELASMLVAKPTLLRVIAETRDGSGRILARSMGLYPLVEGRTETFKQSGGFLSWESVPVGGAE